MSPPQMWTVALCKKGMEGHDDGVEPSHEMQKSIKDDDAKGLEQVQTLLGRQW